MDDRTQTCSHMLQTYINTHTHTRDRALMQTQRTHTQSDICFLDCTYKIRDKLLYLMREYGCVWNMNTSLQWCCDGALRTATWRHEGRQIIYFFLKKWGLFKLKHIIISPVLCGPETWWKHKSVQDTWCILFVFESLNQLILLLNNRTNCPSWNITEKEWAV